ncbi:YgjV family protein [Streptococcus mutans]
MLFSALGAFCLAYSSFTKEKQHMLLWQISDYIFTIIANLLLGGYTGALTISVSIVRNALILKKKNTKVITICLVLIQIALGTYVNNLGLVGYLPIISSVSYTLTTFLTSKMQFLRWLIIENMSLWFIYDLTINAYPAVCMDILIILSTLLALYRHQKKQDIPCKLALSCFSFFI